jgi:septum formation protein
MDLILASSSPRRRELLRAAGIPFDVRPSNVPEEPLPKESPLAFSERLARDKATAVWKALAQRSGKLILGADTIVVVDKYILGKPADNEDASRMLRMISGRPHQVITSVCLLGEDVDEVRSENTVVYVNAISDWEIADYIATGEPMDKAGAYGIQGLASRWIPRIEGDYSNVVGLPLALVYAMLRTHGAFNDSKL